MTPPIAIIVRCRCLRPRWSSVVLGHSVIAPAFSRTVAARRVTLLPEFRPADTPSATMSRMNWVCEHCGNEGESTAPVDEIQCPTCGEPVTPR